MKRHALILLCPALLLVCGTAAEAHKRRAARPKPKAAPPRAPRATASKKRAAPKEASSKPSPSQAKKLHRKWRKRLSGRRTSYIGAAGRLLYWKRTIEKQRKQKATRTEREKSREKIKHLATLERKRWRKVAKARKKVERYAKLMRQGRIDPAALRKVMPTLSAAEARRHARTLGEAMRKYHITTARRAAMFLAQIAHESGSLRYTREIWGPTSAQRGYAYILGNHGMDDAYRYRGGGYIQVTGKSNYAGAARGTGLPLVKHPELLGRARHAAAVSAWWWASHDLNGVADSGDFYRVTLIINGGTNGYSSRLAYYARARSVASRLVPR